MNRQESYANEEHPLHITRRGRIVATRRGRIVAASGIMLVAAVGIAKAAPAVTEALSPDPVVCQPSDEIFTPGDNENLWGAAKFARENGLMTDANDLRDVMSSIMAMNRMDDSSVQIGERLIIPLDICDTAE